MGFPSIAVLVTTLPRSTVLTYEAARYCQESGRIGKKFVERDEWWGMRV
jgi:hypothetical protein